MSFLVVLRRMRQRWFGSPRGGRRRRGPGGPTLRDRLTRPAVELLEDRTLLSVLPAPVVTGQTAIYAPGNDNPPFTSNTPQVAVDPTNPNWVVTVFTTNLNQNDRNGQAETIVQGAYSTDAGQTWTTFDISDLDPVYDPTTYGNSSAYFSMATDPTVAFDRAVGVNPTTGQIASNDESFYVVYSDHRPDNSAGAIVLQKFNFSTGVPNNVPVYPTLASLEAGPGGGSVPGILYEWAPSGSSEPALNPVVAADTGLPPTLPNPSGNSHDPKVSYIDPSTKATQTDNFVVPLVNESTGQVETDSSGNPIYQGNVYVAWNTNNSAPTGIYQDRLFNPNVIKVIASADGAQSFTAEQFLNNDNSFDQNDSNTLNPKEGFAAPRLVVSQGTNSDRPTVTVNGQAVAPVSGGQLTGVWDDFGLGEIQSGQVQDGGTAALYTNTNETFITDATAGASGAPDIPATTLSSVDVNITDPNFKLSDLDVTVNVVHPNDEELSLTLLPASQLFHAVDVAINPSDGNLYVTSENSNSVVEYSGTTGALIGVFVSSNEGGLIEPTGLVWGPDGDLYVSSAGTDQVMRYSIDPTTKKADVAPAPGETGAVYATSVTGATLLGPEGVTFGPDGNLYVSSNGNNQVLEYQGPSGAVPGASLGAFVKAAANGNLASPEGLVFGPDGNLYVASAGGSSSPAAVMRYVGSGAKAGTPLPANPTDKTDAVYATGNGLVNPFGVTFGADGQLYVSDGNNEDNSGVLRFSGPKTPQGPLDADTTPGQFLGAFVDPFNNPTGLGTPGGLVFVQNPSATPFLPSNGNPSLDGDLFVVDQTNNRVLRFSQAPGDPQPAQGQSGANFVAPGSGGLTTPRSMLYRNTITDNDLLVADPGKNTVDRYDATAGTLLGTYITGGSLSGPSGLAEYGQFGTGADTALNNVVFVSSENNGLILEYQDGASTSAPAVSLGTFASNLHNPTGLVWNAAGTMLYVAENAGNPAAPNGDILAFQYNASTGTFSLVTGTGEPTGIFASDPNLQGPTGLILDESGDLLVSSSGNNEVLSFNASSGGASNGVVTSSTVNPSPLQSPGEMAIDPQTNSLYVTSTGNNRVLRFDLTTHKYLETIVPAANNAANADGLGAPYGVAVVNGFSEVILPDGNIQFQTSDDLLVTSTSAGQGSVLRYTLPPGQDAPSGSNNGADFVTAGGGGTSITLVENHENAAGKSNGDNPFVGIQGANIGVEPGGNKGSGVAVGATFDPNAPLNINDQSVTAPYIGNFQPESFSFFGSTTLSDLLGEDATKLNGVWTLEITDYRHDTTPVQYLQGWSLDLTSGLDAQPSQTVVATTKINGVPQPGSPLAGSFSNDGSGTAFPNAGVTLTSPDRGIGPGPVIASDNTLGSFSPYQGRLYVAYTGYGTNGVNPQSNPADDTDIYLITSDDGGATWSAPTRVNDDSITDGFSEGSRPKLDPSVAVDQSTGTLVLSWLDARNDASRARVTTYLATSLDGGATFAPETYVNASQTATDALTGQTDVLEPIPDNMSAGIAHDTMFDYGDHQGLAVADGHVYPVWAGNENATQPNGRAVSDILTANVTIAAGPRILSSTMGPVTAQTVTTDDGKTTYGYNGGTNDPNGGYAADGTELADGFLVTFDRPVAAASFQPSAVTIEYRDAHGDPAVTIPTSLIAVHPIDGYTTRYGVDQVGGVDPNTGLPYLSTTFLVTFGLPAGITDPVGTYSYAIAPIDPGSNPPDGIRDRIPTEVTNPNGTVTVQPGNLMDQNGNAVPGEPSTATSLGDTYAVPTPTAGGPFVLPYNSETLPLIVPGPHVVQTFVPGLDANGNPINPPTPDNLVLNGTVNAIDVVFDRNMDPSSVENPAALLRLIGPYGNIPLTTTDANGNVSFLPGVSIIPDPNSGYPRQINGQTTTAADPNSAYPRTYQITLPTRPGDAAGTGQDLSGTYTLTLAPVMKSEAGDLLDTNENAGLALLRGTATNPAQASFVNDSHAYSGANTISPGVHDFPINFTNALTDQFAVQHVQLQLNITYPHDPDLQAALISPTGTRVQLFTHVGNNGTKANFLDTTLDDNASTPIQDGVAPFSNGTYNPQLPLSLPNTAGFYGENAYGTWTLEIEDDGSSSGTLNGWSLTLQNAVPGTGLGETVADQATTSFRIFTQNPQDSLSHDTWTAVGPAGENGGGEGLNAANSGRIGGLAFDPSDPTGNTVYLAGASGGVWKTTDFLTTNPSGPTYVPLTDFGPTMAINIGSIAVFGRNNDPNQSIVIASTGEGDTGTTGVGFLRSEDGGATWTLLDSTVNVYDSTNDGGNHALDGQPLPINSPLRDHKFVGTTSFKVLVDPQHAPTGPNDVIIYAALAGANGGLWRSMDSGNHWQLMSNPSVQGTDCTDIAVAAASFNQSGNLQVIYAAFEGKGVYMSGTQGTNLTLMAGTAANNQLVQDGDKAHPTPIPVNTTGSNPNGAFGRIVLAAPALVDSFVSPTTHQPLFTQEAQDPKNEAYDQWLYAVVVNTDDTLQGLYLTKDDGATWTQVQLPEKVQTVQGVAFGIPTNDESQPNHDPFGDPAVTGLAPQGNYDVSLATDPNNPNVVYLGGANDLALEPAGGLLRVDTTGIEDPQDLVAFDNDNPDGGKAQKATTGSATLKNPLPNGDYGVIEQEPDGSGVGTVLVYPSQNTPYLNLVEDPNNPFLTNAPILVTGVSQLNNTGEDASYMYFNGVGDSTDQHRVIAMKDPVTGDTRLVFGDDQGVFSVLTDGSGQILTDLSANDPLPSNSRNGNLQITQFYYGAAQPSVLAAEVAADLPEAGGLFYGNAQDDGYPVSDPHVLTDGNIDWNGPTGDGSGIVTDQTGSGTAYSYQWPATGIDAGLGYSNFFLVNPDGTGYVSRTGTGGLTLNPNDRTQWPLLAEQFGPNLAQSVPAVNPIDGDQILISSATGELYRSEDQGRTWFVAALPATLDSTYAPALAYGAPDPADPSASNLDDFLYAGTSGGNLFVSLDGGADWTKLNGAGNLDGSAVVAVSADPQRGSHDAYVTTLNGVYHVSFSASYPTGAAPVVSNVAWTTDTGTGAGNLFNLTTNFSQTNNGLVPQVTVDPTKPAVAEQHLLTYLSALAVDWRQQIPNASGSGTHPALYVGGNAGVYRSLDNGKTWTIFPDQTDNGSPVQGGYLPMVPITHLDLSVGNINPTTGLPSQSTGPNVLLATTYGRGEYAIRLDNYSPYNPVIGPQVAAFTAVRDPNTTNGVEGVDITFGVRNPDGSITPTAVDPSTFTKDKVVSFTDPNGNPITVTGVQDVTPTSPGTPDAHNVFEVTFATQTTPGTYTMTVGPQIYDFSGHAMDQDGEGDSTPDAQDAFTGSFVVGASNPNGLHVISAQPDNLTTPPGMSSITVTFNAGVNVGTFQAALTGPNGKVAVNVSDANPGTDTTFVVSFAAQTTAGSYTLTVPNTVQDKNGNYIDQDEDGTPYQRPTDGFSQTFAVSPQNQGGGGGGSSGSGTPLPTGPVPPGLLNVLVGPPVPYVTFDRHGHPHKHAGEFVQVIQVFNVGNQPIQGPLFLFLLGLAPPPHHHHQPRLINGELLALTGLDPFSPSGAMFTLVYKADKASDINPIFEIVSL